MPKSFVTSRKSELKTTLIFAGLLLMSNVFADPLKVCSDPDNMPFSKSEGSDKGLYIELAEMVGVRLGTSIEYVWWLTHNQRRAVRNTMDSCEAQSEFPTIRAHAEEIRATHLLAYPSDLPMPSIRTRLAQLSRSQHQEMRVFSLRL